VRTLITITGLHKQYGKHVIFDDAAVAIGEDHRLGVIGRNGAGKSTLCRIILGEEEVDAGRVTRHADLRLSYLEQKDPFQAGETVLDFLMRYSGAEDWRCGMLAGRFLLSQELLAKQVSGLSGGYQTRVKLAAMLLKEPNFLILDEPTNYLDLRTLILLEDFLTSYSGGYMIVSHDREFLKKTCRETLAVDHGRITFHPGNVEDWLAHVEQEREQAEHHNANVATRRKELETFIAKNKAKASKATQAASKMKMLERLETIQVDHPATSVTITIPKVEDRKGTALRINDLVIGYPGKTIANDITFEIERGAHVAVLGDNGQGKTTFLNTLAGALPSLGGTVRWGHEIRVGYYAQHVYSAIDGATTVQSHLEKMAASGPGYVTTQQVLDLAGSFLFRGDDVKKKVAVLSGGERSRLCLAGLLLAKFPVLMLDEPTNHLDFETVEALAAALADYNGTVFFTSHDRTFVSLVATDIIEVKDGQVKLYGDGYDTYVYRIEKEVRDAENAEREARNPKPARSDPKKDQKSPAQGGGKDAARRRQELATVEKRLRALEEEQRQLHAAIAADPVTDAAARGRRLAELTAELAKVEERWLELSSGT
jgi:ATP-binding cassette subfamily F protein 3